MNQRWNIRTKTMKLLKVNIDVNLHDLVFGNAFSDIPPKVKFIIEKLINWTLLKLKASALWQTFLKNEKIIHRLRENICYPLIW